MKYKTLKPFPNNFLWGASSSAFQIEGAYDEDGKGLSTADVHSFLKSDEQADSKVASDHYHHVEEDVALMKELGLKAYRFSIAWTRIYPDGNGELNQKGIDFYSHLLDLLVQNEITPVVTLYHFDLPQALVEQYGGWESRQCIDDFCRYAETCFREFGNRVKYWIVINEQNLMLNNNVLMGINDEDVYLADKKRHKMNHHMCVAHARIVKLCHELVEGGKIGPALAQTTTAPYSCRPEDVMAAIDHENMQAYYLLDVHYYGEYPQYYVNYLADRDLLPEITEQDKIDLKADRMDFIALNYYGTGCVEYQDETDEFKIGSQEGFFGNPTIFGAFKPVNNPYLRKTQWGWAIDGKGFRVCLNKYWSRYHLPILISENGMGAVDVLNNDDTVHDSYRIEYLREHLENMQLAMQDGVEMIGYCTWTFMDVLSSKNGFSKRYGLVYVNREEHDLKDLRRVKKDSFYWYQKVIRTNGNDLR